MKSKIITKEIEGTGSVSVCR